MQTFGVLGHSTLHCIRGRVPVDVQSLPTHTISNVEERLGEVGVNETTDQEACDGVQEGQEKQPGRTSSHRFFVFCKACKEMKPGKLRVRCADCKDEAFLLSTVSYNCIHYSGFLSAIM